MPSSSIAGVKNILRDCRSAVVYIMFPRIRLATEADFPLLDELERACPMSGGTTMFLHRQGDYTRVLRFFTKGYLWVAEVDDRLVGSLSWSWHTVLINGRPEKLGWLTDARIHPDYRKTTLIYRLLHKAYQQGCEDDVDLTVGVILEGNEAIEVLASGRAGFPSFKPISPFHMLQLYPGLPIRENLSGLTVRSAVDSDLSDICHLLNTFYQDHQFYIEATPERLQSILNLAEGMRLEDYTLAFRNGEPVAVVHTWDQDSFKKAVVMAYHPYHAAVVPITRLLNRFTSLPGLPKPGGTLRYLWLRDMACIPGHENDLKQLVRHTYRKVKQPYHFVVAASQDDDPLAAMYRGIFRTRITMNMWACSLNGRDLENDIAPHGKQLFHDFTLT
jgi:hypothetical protein